MNKKEIILISLIVLSTIGTIYTCIDSENRTYNSVSTEQPYVEKSMPNSRARFIDIDSGIKIYFNKNMKQSTITKENIYLIDQNGIKIDFSLSYDKKIAILQPTQLLNNAKYKVKVSKNCKDTSGNNLEMAFESEFQTIPLLIPIIQTGQSEKYKTFDDGDYKIGYSRNFIKDEFNKIVEDEYTGQQWQDDESIYSTKRTFEDSQGYCENLEFAGYKDWRLPEIQELFYLTNFNKKAILENKFLQSAQNISFWSNSLSEDEKVVTITYNDFKIFKEEDVSKELNARCIRGPKLSGSDIVSTSSYSVTDKKTGLVWQDNNKVSTIKKRWKSAIQYCEDMTLGGFMDWRLPNINELAILNFGIFSNSDEITNNVKGNYISSTSYKNTYLSYDSLSEENFVKYDSKSKSGLVRCVRRDK